MGKALNNPPERGQQQAGRGVLMQIAQGKSAINRMLQSHGLGRLEDGAGLLSQLGFLVEDHEHLRSLLARCEPENRSAMNDSHRPSLRFTPKPLVVYIAESADRAARQGLPTIDAGGQHPTAPAYEPNGDVAVAQAAANEAFANHQLTVTCRKCTKAETFSGVRKADAVQAARDAGWVYDIFVGKGAEI